MPILQDDIKLLASAVMADTPDGGGAMTGNVIADGVSNNLFPDTSAVDRALGRVNIRQIFGVAQTNDNNSLLGTHAMVVDAPDDPLVHCTLMAAPRWGATREEYKDKIERYLVKGPLLDCYVYEAHYEGSLILRLFAKSLADLPAGGDSIVVRLDNGSNEQYLRVMRVALSSVVVDKVPVNIASCELGQALAFDFPGKNPGEIKDLVHPGTTGIFTTTISAGAAFFGIKPLGEAATVGQYQALTSGGVFSPIVPAATVESPLVDQYPLTLRQTLSRTARAAITLPAQTMTLSAGVEVFCPTPIEPNSFAMTHGTTSFTDDGAGNLRQGTTTVGAVFYSQNLVLLASGAPSYGSNNLTISYKPATVAQSGVHSDAQEITVANQGLVYTNAFEPPPAPGTFTLSYMAQGRWYSLTDNGNGRLSGGDTSYGVGTVSYTTGSIGVTLGALPDVGSALIYQWGDAATAEQFIGDAPTKLSMLYEIADQVHFPSLAFAWSNGATNYTAVVDSDGVISGDATGTVKIRPGKFSLLNIALGGNAVPRSQQGLTGVQGDAQTTPSATTVGYIAASSASASYGGTYTPAAIIIDFAPNVLPSGSVDLVWGKFPGPFNGSQFGNGNGSGGFALPANISPGSFSTGLSLAGQSGFDLPGFVELRDNKMGSVVGKINNQTITFGTINYTTGAVQLQASVVANVYENIIASSLTTTGQTLFYEKKVLRIAQAIALYQNEAIGMTWRLVGASPSAVNQSASISAPIWQAQIPTRSGYTVRSDVLALKIGSENYFGDNGSLRKGWNAQSGTFGVSAAGLISDAGMITVTSLPANRQNAITVSNAAIDLAQSGTVGQGVFRTASAPLKTGVFQLQAGTLIGSGNGAGVIAGGGFTGQLDYARGIVRWRRAALTGSYTEAQWTALSPVRASELSYNAVFLQYLPLDETLLGLNTARLPLDGRVPIFRAGVLAVVHNTLATNLASPLTKGNAYSLGRGRVSSVRVKTQTGAVVPAALYTVNYVLGTITVQVGSDIAALPQPWTVEDRIEDLLVVSEADISGKLKFTRSLTHNFPANTSFVSSALPFGDVFGRVNNIFDQFNWTGEWADVRIGNDTLASYNTIDHPITTTNRGAVAERWAVIFTSNTAFRVVGENYGQVGVGDINTLCQPYNTAALAPFFSIPPAGWGGGWAAGNVLRLNTFACGAAFGVVRTVLQGSDTLASDQFTLAFRADVNA